MGQTFTNNYGVFLQIRKECKKISIITPSMFFIFLDWPIRRRWEQRKMRKYMTWLWNRKREWKKPKNQVSILKRFSSRNIEVFQGFQIIREAPEDLLELISWQVGELFHFLFSILFSRIKFKCETQCCHQEVQGISHK